MKVFASFRRSPDPCPVCDAEIPAEVASRVGANSKGQEVTCPTCSSSLIGLRLAPLWRRILAGLGDTLIVCIPIAPLNAWVFSWAKPDEQSDPTSMLATLIDVFTGDLVLELLRWTPTYLALIAYYTIFHAFLGQTFLQKRLGLRISDVHGDAPTLLRAALRSSLMLLSSLSFGLGHIWALFDPHGRAWHDHLSQTYAVRTP